MHTGFRGSVSSTGGLSLLLAQSNVADVYDVCRSGGSSLSQAEMVGCSPSTGEEGIGIKINISSSQGGELSKQGEVVPLQLVDFGNPLLMLELQAWYSERSCWYKSTSIVSKHLTLQHLCCGQGSSHGNSS